MNVSGDELFAALREMRQRFPDWRFGQMISNLATMAGSVDKNHIWDMEDSELLDTLRRILKANSK